MIFLYFLFIFVNKKQKPKQKNMENKTSYENKSKIIKLYNITHPYGKFDGDYTRAWIDINRSLKELCKNNKRNLLLVINRALNIKVTKLTTTNQLCQNLTNISDIYLGINPQTSANIVLHDKLKIIPSKTFDPYFIFMNDEIKNIKNDKNGNIKINDNLQNFLKNANLGYADPSDPNSGSLGDILMISNNKISTLPTLLIIINIYYKLNLKMKNGLVETSLLLKKYFPDLPDNFGYVNLINTIRKNIEKTNVDVDNFTKTRLKQEKKLLNNILSYYVQKIKKK